MQSEKAFKVPVLTAPLRCTYSKRTEDKNNFQADENGAKPFASSACLFFVFFLTQLLNPLSVAGEIV